MALPRPTGLTEPSAGELVPMTGYEYSKPEQLEAGAASAYRALVAAARSAGFAAPLFLIVSGYRSSARQAQLWSAALAKYGSAAAARKWVAPPGNSTHQTGRAVDFDLGPANSSSNVAALQATPAWRWLVANADRYGFAPYSAEPWHWEYNAAALAAATGGSAAPRGPAPVPVGRTTGAAAAPSQSASLVAGVAVLGAIGAAAWWLLRRLARRGR